MSAAPTELIIRVDAGPDTDDEELAELALRLRDDLGELDAATVRLARTGTPVPGAKSGDVVEWGTLVVSMVSSGALTALIKTADSWLARQRHGISLRVGEDELVVTLEPADTRRHCLRKTRVKPPPATELDRPPRQQRQRGRSPERQLQRRRVDDVRGKVARLTGGGIGRERV